MFDPSSYIHTSGPNCGHCLYQRAQRQERELTRLRRIETVARAALANGNVMNRGSDDADALADALRATDRTSGYRAEGDKSG